VFAPLYDLTQAPLERRVLGPMRDDLLGGLTGDVLDVGAGTGANLPYFRSAGRVVAVEPDRSMRSRLVTRAGGAEVVAAPAEDLPFPDAAFDAVVATLVLCSVADLDRALAEIRRVLRPDGRLVVLEHVRGQGRLAWWQDHLTPVWSRLVGGCRLNRDTRAAMVRAGFAVDGVDDLATLPSWVPTRTMVRGVAVPA
jgi:ubiquinone/menaquinone biosynthesis C-methylase UbiE